MASFAPGTNRDYANAYNNWWFGPGRQGASPAPQRSAFGPDSPPQSRPSGQAQPAQPQGTPYGSPTKPPPAGMVYNKAPSSQPANFSAYAPQQQTNFSAYQPAQQAPSNPFAQYNPQQTGNFVQQQMGLPSFQFTATDSFGNTYDNPAALTAQQGAMAQALNAQRAQQIQSGNIGQLNPMAAYQQAQNMVQGGWTNPFAAQPDLSAGARPSPNTTAPDGTPFYLPPGIGLLANQGQAQPIQPPSQGTPYGQPLQASPARPGYTHTPDGRLLYSGPPEVGLQAPPPSQAAPPRSYADERRAQDQAAYEELMQQIRTGGGSMFDNMKADRRKAALERRLGMTQAPAQPGAAQPPVILQHSPNDTLNYEPGPYRPGTFQPIAWGPDGMKGTADDQPYTRPVGNPGQAQPVQPPSQGTQYGQPVLWAHEDPMNPTGPNYTPPPRPGQPPSQMPTTQQGPTLASFLESESGLTIDDVMAKGGMMWSTLNHYLGGKLNAKQKTQLQQIQNAWRAKEQMKGGLGGATGIWEMPPEAKYGPPEKRKKAQAEWEQKKAWQKQRDDAEIKQQLSDLLNSVSGGGPKPSPAAIGHYGLQTGPAPFQPQFGYTGR